MLWERISFQIYEEYLKYFQSIKRVRYFVFEEFMEHMITKFYDIDFTQKDILTMHQTTLLQISLEQLSIEFVFMKCIWDILAINHGS